MVAPERHFFEIPIYRCLQEQHTEELQEHKNSWMAQFEPAKTVAPESYTNAEHYWEDQHWYPWQYNEVIGWLRLYKFGSQIRGELWFTSAKRIGPRPTKPFFCLGKAFEPGFHPRQTDDEIFAEVVASLHTFQKTKRMKGRFLDLECFAVLGPSICWRKLMGFETGA